MGVYKRILLAVDLVDESAALAERAVLLATALGAELELLHVVEPVALLAPDSPEIMAPVVLPSQDEVVQSARRSLLELAARAGVPAAAARVRVGNTKSGIVETARERGADLIVLGSRERHGLSLLLDLTEDSVLHHAPCDVLAIRVKR